MRYSEGDQALKRGFVGDQATKRLYQEKHKPANASKDVFSDTHVLYHIVSGFVNTNTDSYLEKFTLICYNSTIRHLQKVIL